jgi:hypothetical protein
MANGQIVSVKIQPYLKEFFIHKHGSEPILAKRETKFFMFISQYLTIQPKNWRPPQESLDTLLIELPKNNDVIDIRKYNYISPRHYGEIKTYIYGLFFGAFISYMNQKVFHENWAIKYAIINFCDEHNMCWSKTNYDTLQKIYYRYRFPGEKIDEKNVKNILPRQLQKKPLSVHYPSTDF